ncbi:MAG: DUF2892 domain-containing protein [Halothece sp.]
MSQNVGWLDRVFRLGGGGLLLFLGINSYSGTTTGIILSVAAAVLALTAIVGICPVYSILGFKTCRSQ